MSNAAMSNPTMGDATNSNVTTKTKSNRSAKYIFDLISLTALKVEVILLIGIILTCAFKVITSFVL